MRFNNAMLLLSSLSLLSVFPLSVVALPIRIVVVEKVHVDEVEGFMRSVRIGHAAAAGANFDGLPSRPIDAVEETDDANEPSLVRILPFDPEADPLPSADNEDASVTAPVAIPMTPADESDVPPAYDSAFLRGATPEVIKDFKEAERVQCEARKNSWKSKFGSVKNWFRELFGLSTIAARSVDCEEWAELRLTPSKPLPSTPTLTREELISKVVQAYRDACEQEKKTWRAKMGRASTWVREHLGLEAMHEEPSVCRSSVLAPFPISAMASSRPTNIPPTFHRVTLANSSPIAPPTLAGGKPCHNNVSRPVNTWGAAPITASGPRRRPGHYWRPKTFTGRLQKALYSLSPWEGRALAFVLGCGLGVLLRMVYVFILLGVRAWQSRNLKRNNVQLSEDSDINNSWQTESIVDAVILFDAASIKSLSRRASMESLQIYNEKQ